MKSALIIAALSSLAVSQYPANWIDFNGGTNSGAGGSPNIVALGVKDPKGDEAAKMTFPTSKGADTKDKGTAKGTGGSLGDIFGGIGLSMPKGGAGGSQGSGLYPAKATSDPSLPDHTIFAPITPPTGVKLPIVVWGNGGCLGVGTVHGNVLTEFASHGYYVIANGKINGSLMSVTFSKNTDLFDSINWVTEQSKSGKLSYVDSTKIASMGQSCGGMQAYTAGQDKRVTQTVIVNSGLMGNASTLRDKLSVINHPIGYFLGGKMDMAYPPVSTRKEKINTNNIC
jgi:dienelactone hydrolase